MFNRGNQAEGSQQQALAASVAGFATALVTPPGGTPEKLLSRIAHKHASLGIRPDQYQVVAVSRGVAPRDIQYEVFGPDLWQADLD